MQKADEDLPVQRSLSGGPVTVQRIGAGNVYNVTGTDGIPRQFTTGPGGYVDFDVPSQPGDGPGLTVHKDVQIDDPANPTKLLLQPAYQYANVKTRPPLKNKRSWHFMAANWAAFGTTGKGSPVPDTWHHHKDKGRMQLIDASVHGNVPHNGAATPLGARGSARALGAGALGHGPADAPGRGGAGGEGARGPVPALLPLLGWSRPTRGCSREPGVFDFVEDGQLTDLVVGPLFHFLDGTEESDFPGFNLMTIVRTRQGTVPPGVIPFCQDPGGNVIAFDYRQPRREPSVVFVDHEMPDPERNRVWAVADDFATFLDRLHP